MSAAAGAAGSAQQRGQQQRMQRSDDGQRTEHLRARAHITRSRASPLHRSTTLYFVQAKRAH